MDFSKFALTEEQAKFRDEVRAFLDEYLTEEVYAGARERCDHFDKGLYLELGRRGWLMPRWKKEDGGADLDDVSVRILEKELAVRNAPATVGPGLVWPAVDAHAEPSLRAELMPKVAAGEVRFCLGYSEPDGGSDIAGAKTRAVRDGDEWVINGQKIFTRGAHNCESIFLVTRTAPTRRADQYYVLQRGPPLRPVPHRGGQQRLVGPARPAGHRTQHRRGAQQARRPQRRRRPYAAPELCRGGRGAVGQGRSGGGRVPDGRGQRVHGQVRSSPG